MTMAEVLPKKNCVIQVSNEKKVNTYVVWYKDQKIQMRCTLNAA